MKQILKKYETPTDVFVTSYTLSEQAIGLTDDYETLWVEFPDRIERMYIDTSGYFDILHTKGELQKLSQIINETCSVLVLEQFTGTLSIDVIGDVTEISLLKDNFNKSEYLFEQLEEYDDEEDSVEYVLYVNGDYDDVYTTTLDKYLKNND